LGKTFIFDLHSILDSLRMNGLRCKLLLFILTVPVFILSGAVFVVKCDSLGWQVDVYTQKEPINGFGFGMPSDAFAPDENVVLFAYVTYNSAPVQNVLVSYQVYGPPNNVQNVSFNFVAKTNDAGLAQVNFTIPWHDVNSEAVIFGEWTVVAWAENTYDFVCFKVGWIVKVESLRVVDVDPPQGGLLGVEVSLENIAMTVKNASLALVLFDSSRQIVGGLVCNLSLDSGCSNFSFTLQVPLWAVPGWGLVNAAVLTPWGESYSPSVSSSFYISLLGDVNFDGKVDIKDVSTVALAFGAYPGHILWNRVADINKDGKIDIKDVALVSRNFGRHLS
jgi:hypothetical protein